LISLRWGMRAGLISNQWKRERVDAYRICVAHSWVCAYKNFNSLLVLQLFRLWIGLGRVGSCRVTAFVGQVGSGLEILTACNSEAHPSRVFSHRSCKSVHAFLPRCMQCRRGLAMRNLSVCLSVWQTCGLWQNRRKIAPDSYTVRKIISPSFLERRMVGGATPSSSTWNFGLTGLR